MPLFTSTAQSTAVHTSGLVLILTIGRPLCGMIVGEVSLKKTLLLSQWEENMAEQSSRTAVPKAMPTRGKTTPLSLPPSLSLPLSLSPSLPLSLSPSLSLSPFLSFHPSLPPSLFSKMRYCVGSSLYFMSVVFLITGSTPHNHTPDWAVTWGHANILNEWSTFYSLKKHTLNLHSWKHCK